MCLQSLPHCCLSISWLFHPSTISRHYKTIQRWQYSTLPPPHFEASYWAHGDKNHSAGDGAEAQGKHSLLYLVGTFPPKPLPAINMISPKHNKKANNSDIFNQFLNSHLKHTDVYWHCWEFWIPILSTLHKIPVTKVPERVDKASLCYFTCVASKHNDNGHWQKANTSTCHTHCQRVSWELSLTDPLHEVIPDMTVTLMARALWRPFTLPPSHCWNLPLGANMPLSPP